jgi:hypothetical protein
MGRYFVALRIGVQPTSRQPKGLSRSRGPQIARFEVPAGMITIPAKRSRHDLSKTLLAAGRPLRRGECSNVYLDDLRSARSV